MKKADKDALRVLLKKLDTPDADDLLCADFVSIVEKAAAPGEDLAWLAAYDLDPAISNAAFVALLFTLKDEEVSLRLREDVLSGAGPVLLKALQSPGVPDARKYAIGPLYALCAGDLSGEEYRSFFKDFDAVVQQELSEVAMSISDAPESVDRVVFGMESLLDEETPAAGRFAGIHRLAENLIESNPAAAAAVISANLVASYEEGIDDEDLDMALGLLDRTRSPRAVWALSEMGRWPGLGVLGEKAERLANKLRLSGIQPRCELASQYSHGLISASDGSGSRQVALFFLTPEGGMDTLLLLLNDLVGVKDCMCFFEDGADVEEQIRATGDEVLLAPCSLEFARKIMADLWAFHEKRKKTFPSRLFVYRPYLGEKPILAAARTPDLSVYRLDDLELTPGTQAGDAPAGLFEDGDLLGESKIYSTFSFASDNAYEYVAAHAPKRSTRLPKKPFETFLQEVAVQEKELLLRRIAVALEVEWLAGRANYDVNQVAAAHWLGLSRDVMPFHEVPYIRLLGEQSVEMILWNLRAGYRNQAEANEASLMMDRDMQEMFDEENPFEDRN